MARIPDEHIFEAALSAISAHGYAGATTRQIAAQAEINEVTLFRRFGTKARLIEAALRAEVERFHAAGGARYTGDLRGDLTQVVALYAELVARSGRLVPILLAELPRDDELGALVELPQEIIRAVADLLARYQREGRLIAEAPLSAVASLLGPLLIVALLGPLKIGMRPPAPDPAAHVERYLDGRATR